jgi:hypothetical protein
MEWWQPLNDWWERLLLQFVDYLTNVPAAQTRPANHHITAAADARPPRVVISPTERTVIGPAPARPERIVIAPGTGTTTITPPARAAWDEQGWVMREQDGKVIYEGNYRVRSGAGQLFTFPGRIVVRRNNVAAYVADPPPGIKRHPKGPCFQLTKSPWFRVHWHRAATNVDDALLYVQRILAEVIQ